MQTEIELGARLGRSIAKSTTSTVRVPKPDKITLDIPIDLLTVYTFLLYFNDVGDFEARVKHRKKNHAQGPKICQDDIGNGCFLYELLFN